MRGPSPNLFSLSLQERIFQCFLLWFFALVSLFAGSYSDVCPSIWCSPSFLPCNFRVSGLLESSVPFNKIISVFCAERVKVSSFHTFLNYSNGGLSRCFRFGRDYFRKLLSRGRPYMRPHARPSVRECEADRRKLGFRDLGPGVWILASIPLWRSL